MSHSSSDPTNERTGTARLTEPDLHRLLSSERRRILLDVLDERSIPVDVEELALAIAEREEGVDSLRADDVERVAISLHHHHLPRLADGGIVDYRPASNRVESFDGLGR